MGLLMSAIIASVNVGGILWTKQLWFGYKKFQAKQRQSLKVQ